MQPKNALAWQFRFAAYLFALLLPAAGWLPGQEKKSALSDADLVERTRNSVVFLLAEARSRTLGSAGSGSGFFVAPGGQVVTNYHVIDGMCLVLRRGGNATRITVSREGGQDFGEPQLLAWDERRDLAVLQISGVKAPGLPLGDSSQLRLGEDVFSLGYPLSLSMGFNLTFTKGNVSAIREVEGQKAIQHTATIAPGSSGGPLLDHIGTVVGINYSQSAVDVEGGARIPLAGNINFAIPSNDLRNLLSQAKTPIPLRSFCQSATSVHEGHSQEQQPEVTQIFQSDPQCLRPGERSDFSGELQEGTAYVFAVKRLQGSGQLALGVGSGREDFRATDQERDGVLLLPYTPDHSGSYSMRVGVLAGHDRTCFLLALFVATLR